MRAAPEQVMICDIHDILATGQDLNRTDAQGATLVSETAWLHLTFLQPAGNETCPVAGSGTAATQTGH